MRMPEEVFPIQSEAEFGQVLAEIRTLSGEAASEGRALASSCGCAPISIVRQFIEQQQTSR